MSEIESNVFRGSSDVEPVMRKVFARTRAGRVTLRLPADDQVFPVYVEVRRPEVVPTHDYAADPASGTFQFLTRERKALIQTDCRNVADSPPTVLIEKYGVGAQILVPIVVADTLVGIISVHHVGGPREWTADEVSAATSAAAEVSKILSTPQQP